MPESICLAIGCIGVGCFFCAARVWSEARLLLSTLRVQDVESERRIALVVEQKLNRQFRDRFADVDRQLAGLYEDVALSRGSWPYGVVCDEDVEAGVWDEPTICKLKEASNVS